jgi:hypothetical protein
MSTLLLDISVALAVAGVLAGVAAFAATGVLRPALALTLDLLLAAGLLRLIVVETWIGIASVAAVVLIRKLAAAGIGTAPARDHSRARRAT